jgi:hypothetical protein
MYFSCRRWWLDFIGKEPHGRASGKFGLFGLVAAAYHAIISTTNISLAHFGRKQNMRRNTRHRIESGEVALREHNVIKIESLRVGGLHTAQAINAIIEHQHFILNTLQNIRSNYGSSNEPDPRDLREG